MHRAKAKIPVVVNLTADYLQEKNVITEDRKPDIKGIINSFSNGLVKIFPTFKKNFRVYTIRISNYYNNFFFFHL